tara:strand:- start:2053 stop:3120 length:1068 start_codon:yes stop_codon:yes gene_type:complete
MLINKLEKNRPFIISGPCSAESEKQVLRTANSIKSVVDVFRAGLWKPRTKPNNFEGVGEKGLNWLNKVQRELEIKVCTEVATPKHVDACLKSNIDMLWIGARTTVNPFYVEEIAQALKGHDIPILIKNPTHPDINLWIGAFERLKKQGVNNLVAVHRGFYNDTRSTFRNEPRWEKIIKFRKANPEIPIICDPSHISGNSKYVKDISQIAMDLALDGLMIESHFDPKIALSDRQQQISPKNLIDIVNGLILRSSELKDNNISSQLRSFRLDIDNYDMKILELLMRRENIVKQIANLKHLNGITVFQLKRWFEILDTRREKGEKLDLDENFVYEIFEIIHKYSILKQTKILQNLDVT